MDGNLIVYKASAGSGKTFTLATDYIALLLEGKPEVEGDYEACESYKHVLAVTFTNKATTEMKERILQHLYGIAHNLPESDGLLNEVKKRLPDIDEKTLRRRAGKALGSIIHDYDRFNVTTIDSFFQTLLSNLAHELGLSANFHIDIDDKEALKLAVKRMIAAAKYGSKEFNWIMHYIGERVKDGEKWDISKEVEEFAKNLLRADYLRHESELTRLLGNDEFVRKYKEAINQTRKAALKRIAEPAQEMDAEIKKRFQPLGYETFSRGTTLEKFLNNVINGEAEVPSSVIQKFIENAENWYRKTDLKKGVSIESVEPIRKKLELIADNREDAMRIINSCDLSLQLLNPLRLLNEINKHLNEVNKENNRFLLARTPILFEKIVGADDAPFIFEKAGIRYNHIMIDEFQDTSLLQWSNFKKLFVENMASGGDCMLVGDVKQSIYRWRGGDWRLLSNIENDFRSSRIQTHQLMVNYRSEANIIAFNNLLFPLLVNIFDNQEALEKFQIGKLYDDVVQEVPSKKEKGVGYVRVRIEDKSIKDFDNRMLDDMAEQILMLKKRGVTYSDMAILVRNKANGESIISHFSKKNYNIPLISDEAYMLGASPAIQVIIHALKLLQDEKDIIALGYLANHCWMQKNEEPFNWASSLEEKRTLLPEYFTSNIERLREMPLYELCEKIIVLFQLSECASQSTYIYSFLDRLQSFLDDSSSDIKGFLTYWNEVLSSSSVQAGVADGIQIVTIHKSKGLAFHTVLIPYCDWKIDPKPNPRIDPGSKSKLIWCQPKEAPFNLLPLLPIPRATSKAEESIYANDYWEEQRQLRIESLNMLYVAFTRPKENLLIWARHKEPKSNTKINNIGQLLFNALNNKEKSLFANDMFANIHRQENNNSLLTHAIGEPLPSKNNDEGKGTTDKKMETNNKKSEKENKKNPLIYNTDEEEVPILSLDNHIKFIQSNDAQKFISTDTTEANRSIATERGTLLHNILSKIERINDVKRAFKWAENEGLFSKENNPEEMRKIIEDALKQPIAKDWFDGSWRVYNECNILSPGGGTNQRPDRVMMRDDEVIVIDYKFGKEHDAYDKQVKRYMDLLGNMGHTNVRGYIWHPMEANVIEVK